MKLKKTIFILLLCLAGTAIAAGTFIEGFDIRIIRANRDPDMPNVILVVVDTLRPDHLSQYGYPLETSPALDRFAAEATIFENAYATSSWTVPSVTSILSGLNPVRHRINERGMRLSKEIVTLAERLRDAGYLSAGFSDNIHISREARYDQGFDDFFDYEATHAVAYPDMSKMMTRAGAWLKNNREEPPLFLYLQPMNCHGPYRVPEAHQEVLLSRKPKDDFVYYGTAMDAIMTGDLEQRRQISKADLISLGEQYDTAIRYTTDHIGELFRLLRSLKLWDNSLVILASDHGEELFDHGGFSHGYTLYNEVVRVPLMIKLPGQRTSIHRDALVSLMDIYPTVLAALGLKRQRTDGLSLLPFFNVVNQDIKIETSGDKGRLNYRDLLLTLYWKSRGNISALLNRRFKYLSVKRDYTGRDRKQLLYHLISDPNEERNVITRHRKRARTMRKALKKQWRAYRKGRAVRQAPDEVGRMNFEALKALGYLQ